MLVSHHKKGVCEKISDHAWENFPPSHSQSYRYVCKKCGIGSYAGPLYMMLEKYQAEKRETKNAGLNFTD